MIGHQQSTVVHELGISLLTGTIKALSTFGKMIVMQPGFNLHLFRLDTTLFAVEVKSRFVYAIMW
jgi:hypothetical protein